MCTNDTCLITQIPFSERDGEIVKASDGQCYYKNELREYIIRKICVDRLNMDHENFVLPTRNRITKADIIGLGIEDFSIERARWNRDPVHIAEQTQRENDARADAEALVGENQEELPGEMTVEPLYRWGVLLISISHEQYVSLPYEQIDRLDAYLRPDGHVGAFDHTRQDAYIYANRTRPGAYTDPTKIGRIPYNYVDELLTGRPLPNAPPIHMDTEGFLPRGGRRNKRKSKKMKIKRKNKKTRRFR
jgi:hypothetical protein